METELNMLVYEYFETRILFGFYTYGDKLPSAPKVGEMFHLAPSTVRLAFYHLEKQGYVELKERKVARVTYQATPGEFRERALRYFAERRTGIMELKQSGRLLIQPLWKEGLRRWKDEDWQKLRECMAETQPGSASIAVQFFIRALNTLDNHLALNLYWEIIRYVRFPYLRRQMEPLPEKLQNLSQEEILAAIGKTLVLDYEREVQKVFAFLDEAPMECPVKPVSFEWNIYRHRPQLRYTLASQIIREIMNGRFPLGTYLPSIPKLAELYGTSITTIRRTLDILTALGVTKPFHGKGFQVCMEAGKLDFSVSEVGEGLRLYRESLQILAVTVRPVGLYVMQKVSQEKKDDLLQSLTNLKSEKVSYLCFDVFLSFIEENCQLSVVRECYNKLSNLLAWGYPFALSRVKESNLCNEYLDYISKMTEDLSEGCLEAFVGTWEELMNREKELTDASYKK